MSAARCSRDSRTEQTTILCVDKKLAARAEQAKVRMLAGHEPDHWGLGEIEVFGTRAVLLPDDDRFHVNVNLLDLQPGETIHYRLIATNAMGTTTGIDQTFPLSSDSTPQIIAGPAIRIQNGSAKVDGRLNPLGKKAEIHFEYGPTNEYGRKPSPRCGRRQVTPRLVFDTLTDLNLSKTYRNRLFGVNETGTSYGEDAMLEAKSSSPTSSARKFAGTHLSRTWNRVSDINPQRVTIPTHRVCRH